MLLKRNHKIFLSFLLFFGVLAQSLTMFRSGLVYEFGMGFWGANGHDGVWHLALANQVLEGFPPPHPTFSGFRLTNYHYFYDFLLALVNKLTDIPLHFLYFQAFPILLAAGLGFLSFLVGYWWRKDFWTGFWLAFFNYFAGSFGYFVTLTRQGQLGGESLFWSMQSISSLINPPFALSLIVLLGGMFLLLKVKKWTFGKILGTGVLFGILINIKAYAGIVGLAALGTFALVKFLKKEKVYLWIFGLAFIVSVAIFIPINRGASSLFVFQPFWFIHSMIESPDRLYLPRLALARYFLIEKGIGPRLIAIETVGLLFFLLGNLGTRIIGSWDLIGRIRKRKIGDFDLFLISGGLVGLIVSLLFVQKGTAWNTIQFFYYFLFFVNFYAAATMTRLAGGKKSLKYWFLGLIILLTIPTTIASLKDFIGWPPPTALSRGELEGLNFLKQRKTGVVLTFPYDKFEKKQYSKTPIPLKAYESTAYVSAFSSQQTFLEDVVNLNISGYDWQNRREETIKFFSSQDEIWARGFLLNNKIGYIYLAKGQRLNLPAKDLGIEEIFANDEAKIYQVHGIIE